MYAASKSFLSTFGASLAAEVRHAGIDVLVFHPSPVSTRHALRARPAPLPGGAWAASASCLHLELDLIRRRFYDSAASLDILNFFKSQAVGPEQLPDRVFAAIGRTVWQDIGATAVAFR